MELASSSLRLVLVAQPIKTKSCTRPYKNLNVRCKRHSIDWFMFSITANISLPFNNVRLRISSDNAPTSATNTLYIYRPITMRYLLSTVTAPLRHSGLRRRPLWHRVKSCVDYGQLIYIFFSASTVAAQAGEINTWPPVSPNAAGL